MTARCKYEMVVEHNIKLVPVSNGSCSREGRRPHRGGAGGGTLRDRVVRHASHVGDGPGENKAMQALEVTLEEEKNADALLTNIAATLNLRAAHVE